MKPVPKKFSDVVEAIRCPDCSGKGTRASTITSNRRKRCHACKGSGINTEAIDEASGWDTWAISVHDSPGLIVVVPLDVNRK